MSDTIFTYIVCAKEEGLVTDFLDVQSKNEQKAERFAFMFFRDWCDSKQLRLTTEDMESYFKSGRLNLEEGSHIFVKKDWNLIDEVEEDG